MLKNNKVLLLGPTLHKNKQALKNLNLQKLHWVKSQLNKCEEHI